MITTYELTIKMFSEISLKDLRGMLNDPKALAKVLARIRGEEDYRTPPRLDSEEAAAAATSDSEDMSIAARRWAKLTEEERMTLTESLKKVIHRRHWDDMKEAMLELDMNAPEPNPYL